MRAQATEGPWFAVRGSRPVVVEPENEPENEISAKVGRREPRLWAGVGFGMPPLSFAVRAGVAMVCALTLGAPAAASSISLEVIARPVRAKHSELEACFDEAIERNPDLPGGRIVTRYVIEKGGAVSQAVVTENELGDTRMAACVRRVFMSLKYPEDWSQRATINYPLEFE